VAQAFRISQASKKFNPSKDCFIWPHTEKNELPKTNLLSITINPFVMLCWISRICVRELDD
jgi:hypothetical protein